LSAIQKVAAWCVRRPVAATFAVTAGLAVALVTALTWQATQQAGLRAELNRTVAVASAARVENHFRTGASSEALWEMSAQLRRDPADPFATSRLVSALTWRNWPLPERALGPHTSSVTFGAFALGGRRVVTAEHSGHVSVWNSITGRPVCREINTGGSHFSFSRQGGWLVSLSTGGVARAVNLETGNHSMLSLQEGTSTIALSSEGRRLAALGSSSIEIWNLAEASHQRSIELSSKVTTDSASLQTTMLELSPDGERVALLQRGIGMVWDTKNGELVAAFTNIARSPKALHFSADASKLTVADIGLVASIDLKSQATLWSQRFTDRIARVAWFSRSNQMAIVHGNIDSGRFTVLDGETGDKLALHAEQQSFVKRLFEQETPLAIDSAHLLVARSGSSLQIFDAVVGQPRSDPIHAAYNLSHAELSLDGQRLILSDNTRHAWLFDARPGRAAPVRLGNGSPVLSYALSESGNELFAATAQGARLWDVLTLAQLGPVIAESASISLATLSSDARIAATVSRSNDLHFWNPRDGQQIGPSRMLANKPRAISMSPDGKFIAVAAGSPIVELHRTDDQTGVDSINIFEHTSKKASRVDVLRFNRSGRLLLLASDLGISLLDVAARRELWASGHASFDATFSPDEKFVALHHSVKHETYVVKTSTGEPVLGRLMHPDFSVSATFDPSGEQLYTTCMEPLVRVWDLASGEMLRTLSGHSGGVRSVRFSSDRRRLSTASLDNCIRLWDAQFGLPLSEPLTGHGGSVVHFADFAADDRRLVVFSNTSKGLSIWPCETPPTPAPAWLPELAELLSGEARDSKAKINSNRLLRLLELRTRLSSQPGEDFYSRWARWFFADRDARDLSPK
jgi:WD40 repeat protein